MVVENRWITIVGCGPGAPDYVTPAARDAARDAEVLVGAERLLGLFPGGRAERIRVRADIPAVLDMIAERRDRRVVVLASGAPGLCSIAKPVIGRFGAECCAVVPGISSVQVAFARLGLDWAGARVISAHAELPVVGEGELDDVDRVAVLCGRRDMGPWLDDLIGRIPAECRAFLCEDLTLVGERVRELEAVDAGAECARSNGIVVIVRKEVLP